MTVKELIQNLSIADADAEVLLNQYDEEYGLYLGKSIGEIEVYSDAVYIDAD